MLGGFEGGVPRRVTIVDAGVGRGYSSFSVEAIAPAIQPETRRALEAPASVPRVRPSVWPGMNARVFELVRAHRSTIVFVNSRRLPHGLLAAALNDLAANDRGGSGAGRDNGGDNRGDGSNRRETEEEERGDTAASDSRADLPKSRWRTTACSPARSARRSKSDLGA